MLGIKNFVLFAFGLALLAMSASADASLYEGYSDSDYYFEVYYGNSYTYVPTPYTYTYNDYYYFDYPYRVYSAGNYYYYDAGWYSYDSYWRFAPDCISCYTYYPTNYYYYDGYWSYSPGWMYSYAPAYYGSYYMPPAQPTLVGQSFQPRKEAKCEQLTISTNSVTLTAGEDEKASFALTNYSRKFADIENVTVTVDGFDAQVKSVKFDKVVKDRSTGKIEFEVEADDAAKRQTLQATVQVAATFRDGTFCSAQETEENFNVNILPKYTENNYNSWHVFNDSTVKGSTSYKVAKDSVQQWEEVANFDSPYNSNYGNYNDGQNKNKDYSARNYSNYANTNYNGSGNVDNDYGTAKTYYDKAQLAEGSCSGLSFTSESITVNSGETKTAYFTLKNYGSEDFTIVKIDSTEYSPDFTLESTRDSQVVYSGQNAAVKVKVHASENLQDRTGTGYVTVKGHYNSGLTCTVVSDNFYVRVNGFEEHSTNDIALNVPQTAQITGTAGFIEFSFDNPSDEDLTVTVSSGEAMVSPTKFALQANTSGNRTFAINGVKSTGARVYSSVEANGRNFLQKYTKVVRTGDVTPPVGPTPDDNASTQPQPQNPGLILGFFTLTQGALLLGLVILIIIIVALALGQGQKEH